MKNKLNQFMKTCIILIVLFVLMLNSYSQNAVISLDKSTESRFDIQVSTSIDTLEVYIKLAKLELLSGNKNTRSSNYVELLSNDLVEIYDVGKPNIPVFSRLI